MSSSQVFCGKIILILAVPSLIGRLLTRHFWGILLGCFFPILVYFALTYFGESLQEAQTQ